LNIIAHAPKNIFMIDLDIFERGVYS